MLQLTRSHQLILLLTVRICMFDSTNSDVRSYGLPLEYETLPEMLKARGYATHMQGKWHVGYRLERKTPTFRGFDSFIGFMHSGAPSCLCPSGLFRLRQLLPPPTVLAQASPPPTRLHYSTPAALRRRALRHARLRHEGGQVRLRLPVARHRPHRQR